MNNNDSEKAFDVIEKIKDKKKINNVDKPKLSELVGILEQIFNKDMSVFIKDFNNNQFKIHDEVTRQHVAYIIAKILNLHNQYTISNNFHDLGNVPHDICDSINALLESGIIHNYNNGYFRPYAPITWEELTDILSWTDKLGFIYDLNDNIEKNDNITVIKNTFSTGEKVVAIAIKYNFIINSNRLDGNTFEIVTRYNGKDYKRKVKRIYTNNELKLSDHPVNGKYIIIELDINDINNNLSDTFILDVNSQKNLKCKLLYYIEQKKNIESVEGAIITPNNKKYKYGNEISLTTDNFEKSYFVAENGLVINYRLFKPILQNGQTYPLILFLHGHGERGFDNEAQLINMGAIVWSLEKNQINHQSFILAPQLYTDGWWHDESMCNIANELVDFIIEKYPIDKKRLYITGMSKGGMGTWHYIKQRPNFYTAAVPVCGACSLEKLEVLNDFPIWAFHAEDDPVVKVGAIETDEHGNIIFAGSRVLVEKLVEHGNKKIKYTEYPQGTLCPPLIPGPHFSWVPAYENNEMIEWLFKQTK